MTLDAKASAGPGMTHGPPTSETVAGMADLGHWRDSQWLILAIGATAVLALCGVAILAATGQW